MQLKCVYRDSSDDGMADVNLEGFRFVDAENEKVHLFEYVRDRGYERTKFF